MVVVRKLQAVVETDGITQLENSMGRAKTSLKNFGKVAGATGGALAALAAGGIAVAVNEARKFQSAMVELEKVTDPTTAREMSDSIKELAQTIPLAQQELAGIAADAGRFGVEGTKNIEDFTEATAKMATATDLNTTEAGEAFAKLAELTDTPIGEVENLGSSINELSNNFATSAQEIVDSMLRASGAMSQFGISQTDIAGFSAALNAVSESSERAGTRMRRLVQEISNPKKVGDMARALGMTVDEYKAMQKNNPRQLLLQMIEGFKEGGKTADILNKNLSTTSRQALAGFSQNLDGLREALGMSGDAFKENTSLQKEFEAQMNTLDSQGQLLINSLRNIAISVGEVFLPAITGAVRALRGGIQTFSRFNEKTDGVLGAATLLGTLFTGLAAAVIAFSGPLATAAGIIASVSASVALLMGPIGLLTAGIVGLHQAWKTNFAGIRDTVNNLMSTVRLAFNFIMSRAKQVANLILTDLQQAFKGSGAGIEQSVRSMLQTLQMDFFKWMMNVFVPTTLKLLGRVQGFWVRHKDQIIAAIKGLARGAKTAFDVIIGATRFVLSVYRRVWPLVETAVRNASTLIQKYVKTFGGIILDIINNVVIPNLKRLQKFWNQHGNDIQLIVNTMVGAIVGILRFLSNTMTGIITTLVTIVGGIWDKWGDEFMAIARFTFDTIMSILGGFIDTFATLIRAATDAWEGDWGSAWDRIKGLTMRILRGIRDFFVKWGGRFLDYLGELVDGAIGWFEDLYDRLIGGSIIPNMLSDIISAVRSWDFVGAVKGKVRDVISAVKRLGGDFKSAGKGLIGSFIDGIEDKAENIGGAVSGAMSTARGYLTSSDADKGPLSDVSGSGQALPETFAKGILDNVRPVKRAIESIAEAGKPSATIPHPDVSMGRRRQQTWSKNVFNIDVSVPKGVDTDTAARTITDEIKSQNFNS